MVKVYCFKHSVEREHAFDGPDLEREGIYVPGKNVVLFKEETNGIAEYSVSQSPEFLRDVKAYVEGESDRFLGYSDIREVDFDRVKLHALIRDVKKKASLDLRVEEGMESILSLKGK
ncbi:MAG: hypothetical protein WCK90_02805 [archaeon]